MQFLVATYVLLIVMYVLFLRSQKFLEKKQIIALELWKCMKKTNIFLVLVHAL